MKDSTILIVVVAGAALLFWAVSSGLIKTSGGAIPVGHTGVVAPQPSSNYSGYLAANAAPAIAGSINAAISGLGSAFSAWISPSSGPNVTPGQVASPSSPSAAAQPSGPALVSQLSKSAPTSSGYATYSDALVGPQIDPSVSYASTPGLAFDYSGLAADNAFDPAYSLQDPVFA